MDAMNHLIDLAQRHAGRPTMIIGIAGPQGSGKSTLGARLADYLTAAGRVAASVSLDDFYLIRPRRLALARTIHPLLATRGVPGTHDLPLLMDVLGRVRTGRAVALPQFDKLRDDRMPPQYWRSFDRIDILILEGWCVGAFAQPPTLLASPVNELEAEADPDGRWRNWVNHQLAGAYQQAWNRLNTLVYLAAPDWEAVPRWRAEQETRLAQATGRNGMDGAAVHHFCAHYERLTRWQQVTMPARAELTLWLDHNRKVRRASKSPFSAGQAGDQ